MAPHRDEPYRPVIPQWLRDTVYAIGVAVGAGSILVMATAYEWLEPASANRAIVTMGGIASATSFLASTLGIAYRAPSVAERRAEADGDYEPRHRQE